MASTATAPKLNRIKGSLGIAVIFILAAAALIFSLFSYTQYRNKKGDAFVRDAKQCYEDVTYYVKTFLTYRELDDAGKEKLSQKLNDTYIEQLLSVSGYGGQFSCTIDCSEKAVTVFYYSKNNRIGIWKASTNTWEFVRGDIAESYFTLVD